MSLHSSPDPHEVYRQLTGGVLLGTYTITYEPHCLVLRPIPAAAPPWHIGEEVAVGWDPDGYDPMTRRAHTRNTVVISFYSANEGIECKYFEHKAEVELTGETLPSARRLMAFIIDVLYNEGRLGCTDYLDAVAPVKRPMNE